MIIMKILICVLSTIIPCVALVEKQIFRRDDTHVNILCPIASLQLGSVKTISRCAAKCNTVATCRSFFFNKEEQFCKGASIIISTIDGCEVIHGTVYYQTTDVTSTTSTASVSTVTTSATTTLTTTTSAPATTTTALTTTTTVMSEYGNTCSKNADCTMNAFMCNQNTCTCEPGYRYNFTSGSCVLNCDTYGSTYIEYPNKRLTVPFLAEYLSVSLSQCKAYCESSSTCRGFNYRPSMDKCKLKEHTPYTHPSEYISASAVSYYSRNCANN